MPDKHDLGLERAVLGAVLQNPDSLHEIGFLDPADFFDGYHGQIFGAMKSLSLRGEPIDPVTVASTVGNPRISETVAELYSASPGPDNIVTYATALLRYSTIRKLSQAGKDISSLSDLADPTDETSVDSILSEAEKKITSVRPESNDGPRRGDLLNVDLEEESGHVSTGFHSLDNHLYGFHGGRLYIVAARPAVGKSTLGMDFARNFCRRGIGVGFFSIEMTREELLQRAILAESNVPAWQVQKSILHDDAFSSIVKTLTVVNGWPLFIDDSGTLTVQQMVSRAKKLKRANNIGAVIVDYLQKVDYWGSKESRVRELGQITGSMKALAKELDIPVIVLSQLNRFEGGEPNLMNLRDSGEIEQDADVVIMLWRNESTQGDEMLTHGKLAKVRDGRPGHFSLNLVGPEHRFVEIA